jgi:hypothetical protein
VKQSSWAFLGGYLLFFLGWVAGLIAAFLAQGVPDRPYGEDTPQVVAGLVGVAVVAFALGVQILARSYWGGLSGSPETLVVFIMTPIPAVAAAIVNVIGKYFRQSDGTVLRVLLLGGGVYLAATTGMDLVNNGPPTGEDNPAAFFWPFALQGGVALALLGLLPPARTEPAPELAAVEA